MQRKSLWKILLVASAVPGALFLSNYFLDNFLQNLFYRMAAGPGVFFSKELGKLPRYVGGFFNTKEIVMENNELERENKVLLGRIAELEGLRRENEFLRNELEVEPKLDSQLLLAEVFSVQRTAVSSTILINKGKADGVKKSMAVIASGNVLAGVVSEVFKNSALVLLLDDPRSAVSVRFLDSNVLAEARGNLQNGLKVNQATYREEVQEGTFIVTSGLDGLKKSLLVGRVSKVGTGNEGLFREVKAEPIFDLSLGSGVFVILR